MNRYMILIHGDDTAFAAMPAEKAQEMLDALRPFEKAVARDGTLVSTHRLHPARESTLLKIRNGQGSVVDGPFTETKEQLGGYYLVQARDEAQVVEWLKLIPLEMDATLEVRQIVNEERNVP